MIFEDKYDLLQIRPGVAEYLPMYAREFIMHALPFVDVAVITLYLEKIEHSADGILLLMAHIPRS